MSLVRASFRGKYETATDDSGGGFTLLANAGDLKFRASITDATFRNGPSLSGLTLAVEKPGSFVIDYDVPKNDARFMFMNTAKVLDKPVNLTYSHARGDNRTALDGTVVFDSCNKLSANYALDSGNCKVKYSYVHGGVRTFEPSYDFVKNSWDFAVSQRVYDDDLFRASYQSSSNLLGLEWLKTSKLCGGFKISASLNLAEELKMPKLTAESTWNFEM